MQPWQGAGCEKDDSGVAALCTQQRAAQSSMVSWPVGETQATLDAPGTTTSSKAAMRRRTRDVLQRTVTEYVLPFYSLAGGPPFRECCSSSSFRPVCARPGLRDHLRNSRDKDPERSKPSPKRTVVSSLGMLRATVTFSLTKGVSDHEAQAEAP